MIIALLSAVNGALRYTLPIIATLPIVFILCLIAQKEGRIVGRGDITQIVDKGQARI
jgi:hypothetical protein